VVLGGTSSCVSLFGEGSSLAIADAATLADAVAAHRTDPAVALRAYEHQHGRLVMPRQRGVGPASRLLVPASAAGIVMRNTAMRLWEQLAMRRFSPAGAASPGRGRGREAHPG
jgi:2-polyprenyl-6-methoxyphenol hydroxylase-like FAD-dependent oxidoreductase